MSRDLLKALKTSRQKGTLHSQFEENYFFTKDGMYLTSTLGNTIEVGSLSIFISDIDRSMFTILHSNLDSFNAWRQWLSYSSSSALSSWDLEAKKLMQEPQSEEKLKKGLMEIFIRKHGISQRQLGPMLKFYSQGYNKVTSNFAYPMRDTLKVEDPQIKMGKVKTRFYVQNGKLFLNNSETIILSPGYGVGLRSFEVPAGAQAQMQVTEKGYQLLNYQSSDLIYRYLTTVKNGEQSKTFIDGYIDPKKGSVDNIKEIKTSTDQINERYQKSKSSLLRTLSKIKTDDSIRAAHIKKIRFVADSAIRLEKSLDVNLLDFSKALEAMEAYLSSTVGNEIRDIMAPGTQAVIEKYYNLLVKNELDVLNEKITKNASETMEVLSQQVQGENTDYKIIPDNKFPLAAYNLLFEDIHVIATAPSQLQFKCDVAEFLVELNDQFTNPISDYYIEEAKVVRRQIILDGYNLIKGVNIYNLVLSYLQPNPDANTITMIEVMKWLLENSHSSQYKDAIKKKFKEFSIVFFTQIKLEIRLLTTQSDNLLNADEYQRLLTALANAEDLFEPLFRICELPEGCNQYKTNLSNARKLLLDNLSKRIRFEFKTLKARWGSLKHDPIALKEVVLKLQKSVEIYQDARPDNLQTIIWTNQTDALLSYAQAVQAESNLDREHAFMRLKVIRKQSYPFFKKVKESASAASLLQVIKENRQLLIYLHGNIHINLHDHHLIVWLVRNLARTPCLRNTNANSVENLTKDAIEIIRVAKSKLVHNSHAMDLAIDHINILFEKFINTKIKKKVLLTKVVVQPSKEVHGDEKKENPVQLIHRSKSNTEELEVKIESKQDVISTDTVGLEIKENEEKPEAKPAEILIDSKDSRNSSVFESQRIYPEDQIINKILGEFSNYRIDRRGGSSAKEKKYYWCGIFSCSSLSFSIDEKFESISILSMMLIGEKTQFSTKRQIKALFSGDLGKICCKPEYRPVIEKYINRAQLSQAREETIAAIV